MTLRLSIHSWPVRAILAALISGILAGTTSADVKLPAIFSDHAVLQSGKPVNVWGWAAAGESVQVSIGGFSAKTQTGDNGKWTVQLPPMSTGGSQTLEVRGNNTVRVNDVLIGEVWLCSGQSNMAMQLRGLHGEVNDADAVIAKANHPTLRMFLQDDLYALGSTAVPPDEPQFDRPGKWIVCTPQTATTFTAIGYFFAGQLQEQINTPVGLISVAVGGTAIEAWISLPAQQAVPEFEPLLSDWQTRLKSYDPIDAKKKANEAKSAWLVKRAAAVENNKPEPKAPRNADYKNLAVNTPAGLYNGLIAPIIPYTIRGALWYQGERNAGGYFTSLYGKQLQTLIKDWRARWGDDFYLSYVQLPRYQLPQTLPSDDMGWGVWVREGQRQTLAQVPNTSMAITIDLGGATTAFIHPKNKDEFARRLAALALHDVYHQLASVPSGPLYHDVKRQGNRMIVSFSFADGLVASGNPTKPKGFAIAGPDHKFVWAEAEIINGQIAVWSEQVPDPQAVRYDWAGNPIGDVQNSARLPCSPFRTDDWPSTIIEKTE